MNSAQKIETLCDINDSLVLARQMHPGQRNTLDALCKRYDIKNEHRTLHGALLDSEILADVYLAMTGGQKGLSFGEESAGDSGVINYAFEKLSSQRTPTVVVKASGDELQAHQQYLDNLEKSGVKPRWY